MSRSAAVLSLLPALALAGAVLAQETRDLGLPPLSGSQNPVLPPVSGSQNPVLPPPSGQRYVPGVGAPFGDQQRRPAGSRPTPGVDRAPQSSLSPRTMALADRPLQSLAEVGPALARCWMIPADAVDAKATARVRFSLRRDGSLFGQPRASWESGAFDPAARERFMNSAVRAVQRCTPLRLSRKLGESIAGQPFSVRFTGGEP